jgi:hypothetical protein
MLMRVGPTFPGLLDDSEGDERILTSQYTCLKTANAVGPDNLTAYPDDCGPTRSCYKKADPS